MCVPVQLYPSTRQPQGHPLHRTRSITSRPVGLFHAVLGRLRRRRNVYMLGQMIRSGKEGRPSKQVTWGFTPSQGKGHLSEGSALSPNPRPPTVSFRQDYSPTTMLCCLDWFTARRSELRVCVCVCVCVRVRVRARARVCVCVCVCASDVCFGIHKSLSPLVATLLASRAEF